MGICPTGGQANNILRYENLDTGGTCAKTFESDGDVFDPALDVKHDIGIKVPPDIDEDISELQATADEDLIHTATDNYVAELTVFPGPDSQWGLGVGVRMGTRLNPGPGPLRGSGSLLTIRDNIEVEGQLKPHGLRGPAGDDRAEVPPDDRGGVQDLVVAPHTVGTSPKHIVARHPYHNEVNGHDEGGALHGHGGGNEPEPYNLAPADEGGGAEEVHPDIRGATQDSRVQVQVSDDVPGHGGRADPVQAQHGTGRAQAPQVVGGGLITDDAVHNIVTQDDQGGAHVQAPVDEGGGGLRAVDAHHSVVPAGGREHHGGPPVRDRDDAQHGDGGGATRV